MSQLEVICQSWQKRFHFNRFESCQTFKICTALLFLIHPHLVPLTYSDRHLVAYISSVFVLCDVACCRHVLPLTLKFSQARGHGPLAPLNEPQLQLPFYSEL